MDEGFNFKLQKQQIREFPGGPLAGTTCFIAKVQVEPLIGDLRAHKLHGEARNKKQNNQRKAAN